MGGSGPLLLLEMAVGTRGGGWGGCVTAVGSVLLGAGAHAAARGCCCLQEAAWQTSELVVKVRDIASSAPSAASLLLFQPLLPAFPC